MEMKLEAMLGNARAGQQERRRGKKALENRPTNRKEDNKKKQGQEWERLCRLSFSFAHVSFSLAKKRARQ